MIAFHSLRRFLIPILILVLVCMGIGLIWVTMFLHPKEQTIADLLPAKETVALFHQLTRADAARLSSRFPILQDLSPPAIGGVDVGILRLGNGQYGWIVCFTGDIVKTFNSRLPLDTPNRLIRGSSGALALLDRTGGMPALSTLPDYRTLTRIAPVDASWMFLNSNEILSGLTPEDQKLLQQLQNHSSILVQWDRKYASLSFLSPLSNITPLADSLPALTPPPTFSIALTHPQEALRQAMLSHSPADLLLLQGMLQSQVEHLLGTDVSATYDIFPLLGGEASLSVRMSQTGSELRFLLHTSTQDPRAAQHLDRLHRSVAQALSMQRITRRQLPENFTAVTVEDDPAVLEERRTQSGSWTLRMTRRTDRKEGLWTAVNGWRVVITNDSQWLGEYLAANGTVSLPLPNDFGVRIAEGALERSSSRTFLHDSLHLTLPSLFLSTFGPESERLWWSVTHTGEIATITLSL